MFFERTGSHGMRERSLARRYAYAMYDLAIETGNAKGFFDDLARLKDLMESVPIFLKSILDNKVGQAAKMRILGLISKKAEIDPALVRLMELLISRRRIGLLPQILEIFEFLIMRNLNITEVQARIPSNEAAREVGSRIENMFFEGIGMNVRCKVVIDDSLIGGFVVKIGDRVFDASVQGRLAAMKEKVLRSETLKNELCNPLIR